jgi:hypothetical protein
MVRWHCFIITRLNALLRCTRRLKIDTVEFYFDGIDKAEISSNLYRITEGLLRIWRAVNIRT